MSNNYDPADDAGHNLFRARGKFVAGFRKLFSGLHGLIPFRSGKSGRAK